MPRPGLIVGPWDPTNRFTYWVTRLAEDGPALAPAPPEAPAQVIDARDLAGWIVRAAEDGVSGTYNAVGPRSTRAEVLAACRTGDAELVWVDGDFLAEQEVGEWLELPLWLHSPEYAGLLAIDPAAAAAAGLETRPLRETALDTLAWARSGQGPAKPPAGLERAKEQRLLARWSSRAAAVDSPA